MNIILCVQVTVLLVIYLRLHYSPLSSKSFLLLFVHSAIQFVIHLFIQLFIYYLQLLLIKLFLCSFACSSFLDLIVSYSTDLSINSSGVAKGGWGLKHSHWLLGIFFYIHCKK